MNLLLSFNSRTLFVLLILSGVIGGCSNTVNIGNLSGKSNNQSKVQVNQPNIPAQCQANVFLPAKFRESILKLRVFEGSPVFTNTPSTVESTTSRFQTAPARYPQETVPAVYREVTENIITQRRRIEIIGKPASYKTLNKPVTVQESHRIWKKNCVATNPQRCLTRIPTKMRNVKQQIVDIPARTLQVETPEKTLTFKRKVLVTPGKGSGTPIPAQYRDVNVNRVSKTWQLATKQQAPRFEAIPVQTIIRPEVIRTTASVCADKASKTQVRAIQNRLNEQGYQTPMTGVLGKQTLQAIIKFQQDNGLFIGAITLETLRKLGLN